MRVRLVVAATLAVLIGGAVLAERNDPETYPSQVTLARLRWGADFGGFRRGFSAAWNHDYPRAEQHLSMIIKDITLIDIRTDADVVALAAMAGGIVTRRRTWRGRVYAGARSGSPVRTAAR